MNKIKFLLIILFLNLVSHNILFSQLIDKWEIIKGPSLQDNPLYLDPSVRNSIILDSTHYAAINYYGQWHGEYLSSLAISHWYRGIIITDDGGWNWKEIHTEVLKSSLDGVYLENHNRSIAYPSLNRIIVVGDSSEKLTTELYDERFRTYAKMLLTNDGGKNWEKIILDSNTRGQDICMLDDQRGIWAVSSQGNKLNSFPVYFSLLYTEDCWKTYRKIYESPHTGKFFEEPLSFPGLKKIAFLEGTDTLVLSEDLGQSWNKTSIPGHKLSRIQFIDENTGYILAHNKSIGGNNYEKILKTVDGGYHWDIFYDGSADIPPVTVKDIYIYDSNNYLIQTSNFLNKAIIYKRTTNGGKTWDSGYYQLGPATSTKYISDSLIISLTTEDVRKWMGAKQLLHPFTGHFVQMDTNKKYFDVNNTVQWNKVEGATKYQVNVWGRFDVLKSDIYADYGRKHNALSVVTRDTSIDVQLWYSGIYTFSIQAMNDLANGQMNSQVFNGPPSCLTTRGTLKSPIIYSPEAPPDDEIINIDDSLQLRWSRVEGATTYDVIFNINRDVLRTDTLNYSYILILIDYPDTSYTVNTFEPNTEYQFLVGAASSNDHSGFTMRKFKTPAVLGVKEIVKTGDNLIYPNPVRDRAGLRVYINKPVQAEIKLSDYNGNMRSLWQGILNEGKNEIELDVADVPRGFYNIILDYGRGNYVFKFIKE